MRKHDSIRVGYGSILYGYSTKSYTQLIHVLTQKGSSLHSYCLSYTFRQFELEQTDYCDKRRVAHAE